MNAVHRLKRDHQVLRAKLDVLESALNMGPETWYVLREVCFTLARQLRDHIKREEELVAICREALNPNVLAELIVEHRDEPEHLRAINQLFISERAQGLDRIKPVLLQVIRGLRRHMAEEEAELFPVLEHVVTSLLPPETPTVPARRVLTEEMTVNRVVQECPGTRGVFDRLFVNIPYEGCACLDEVAWRHGLETPDLLKMLEEAIASCECATRRAFPEEEETQPPRVGATTHAAH